MSEVYVPYSMPGHYVLRDADAPAAVAKSERPEAVTQHQTDNERMADLINARTAKLRDNVIDQGADAARVEAELKRVPKPALWDSQSATSRRAWLLGQEREIKARLKIR
jgi:hypothetical protein